MGEDTEEVWEGIEGLPETESSVMFASSGATFTIPDTSLHPITKSIAVFVIFIAASGFLNGLDYACLLYTSPSPRDATLSRMPSSA